MLNRDVSCFHTAPIAMLGVPSSAGARRTGQEQTPAALRAAGLTERLREAGLAVVDFGDLPPVPFRPDPDQPRRQNLDRVVAVARRVADSLAESASDGRWSLVLGGDCSLSLGVLAGLLRHVDNLGIVYFDGDIDLNTPETTRSGIFDGMVLAHILGRGAPELARIGPRHPLVREDDVVLFGYDADSGWIDPPELDRLERSRLAKYPLASVRANPEDRAREALRHLENRCEALLVHFDVDVTNLPSADVPHPRGLDPDEAFAALTVFVTSPACAGLVVTEHNVELDPHGVHAETLVRGLTSAIAARRKQAG